MRPIFRSQSPLSTSVVLLLTVLTVLCASTASFARPSYQPAATVHDVSALESVALFEADRIDAASVRIEDTARERDGLAPRFAIPQDVFMAPDVDGTWEQLDESTLMWRLRIASPGAVSLNLGFTRYVMPAGGRLLFYPADGSSEPITFTAADNKDHGELWTPLFDTEELVVEVVLPVKERWNLDLELTSVNVGYREFGSLSADKSGTCNIDVVCPEGDGWRDDIQTVAAYSTGGSIFCTGFMVNNTSQDQTPYFMTANHCSINTSNAASLVVYWNFNSPVCGQQSGGDLTQFQTGSTHRASYATSDFTLVELDAIPDPAHMVAYAGWDRGSQDATGATAIHHPSGDEKSISFEYDATTTASYLGTAVPGDGTHVRVIDWDVGTTEPGSSGSPLFDQNHRVIGQLHGGYAACGNDDSDWYGRISVSWTGGGASSSRLSDWLDPSGTGAMNVDVLAPYASGMSVTPSNGLSAEGSQGGPFTPTSVVYTLENRNDTDPLNYMVSADVTWADVSNGTGTIAAGATAAVTVSLNAEANTLVNGVYSGTVSFVNLTDGSGDSSQPVSLRVGVPELVLGWDMLTDPGWDTQGDWAFGQPLGGGGDHGNVDPTAGATGPTVYGFNLAGDYANNLPETHLTSTAIDCSNLSSVSLKFMRWLNVEQPTYDHAYLRVSNDGIGWTTVWTNGGEVADNTWTQVAYDISAIADGQATVYLRWTMGITDDSWQYSGWNLDDVEIWGVQPTVSGVDDGSLPAATRLQPARPNPFNPMTEISFDLAVEGHVMLSVYDLRGQLVRTLENGVRNAGRHIARWDGTDASGRAMSSGTYLFRMTTDVGVQVQKAVLVR